MFCPQCGSLLGADVRYCQSCGTAVASGSRALPVAPTRHSDVPVPTHLPTYLPDPTSCPNCGSIIRRGARFCPSCGIQVGSETVIRPVQFPKEKQTFKSPLLAAVLTVVPGIFGLWGIGYFYIGEVRKGLTHLTVGIVIILIGLFSIVVTGDPSAFGEALALVFFVGGFINLAMAPRIYSHTKTLNFVKERGF